jgi:glycosyltransferase involved in cell wall biosynthesis
VAKTTDLPLVSVVTAFYNREAHADYTIASILNQDYPNFEYIMVDDGSTDGTFETLSKYQAPNIHVIRQENTGAGGALRLGCSLARGEFIAYHESPDYSFPSRIRKQAALLQAQPELSAVSAYVEHREADESVIYVNKPDVSGDTWGRLLQASIFTHSEMMYRRSAYERVGGYRQVFRLAEDNDLFLRLLEVGPIGVVPEVLVADHRRPGGVMTDPRRLTLARIYRDFAEYCARERAAGRPDPVAQYKDAAIWLRPRSKKLAERLAMDAWKAFKQKDFETAKWIAQRAVSEKLTLRSAAVFLASSMR